MKFFSKIFIVCFYLSLVIGVQKLHAQEETDVEKQLWVAGFFNFRLNDKWTYNQDAAYQHSYETPTFTRIFLRSQINRQISGALSLHGGLVFLYKFNEGENDAFEIRPWLGTKLRWPHFWRFDFSHYVRFEQRFEHTLNVNDWENNFRVRYKLSTNIPLNHNSLVDKTFYGVISYEFFSSSFGDDIRFTRAATHRFDVGLGFKHNVKSSYEAALVLLNGLAEDSEDYSLSSGVLFLKYKRYIHWE